MTTLYPMAEGETMPATRDLHLNVEAGQTPSDVFRPEDFPTSLEALSLHFTSNYEPPFHPNFLEWTIAACKKWPSFRPKRLTWSQSLSDGHPCIILDMHDTVCYPFITLFINYDDEGTPSLEKPGEEHGDCLAMQALNV